MYLKRETHDAVAERGVYWLYAPVADSSVLAELVVPEKRGVRP